MTVSEQVIQVIDALCEKFGIAVDWTSENVIPYITTLCGKLVNFEIWTSIAWIVIWAALSLCCVIATKKFYPTFKKGLEENKHSYNYGWEFATGFAVAGLVFIYFITVLVISAQIIDIIKCLTFPEMFVFEYVQSIMNAG